MSAEETCIKHPEIALIIRPHSARETSVNSSRKTQPKFGHLHLKTAQDYRDYSTRKKTYRMNTQHLSPVIDRSYLVIIKKDDKKEKGQECSAISMQSMQMKVRFNKVEGAAKSRQTLINGMTGRECQNRNKQRKCELSRTLRQVITENKQGEKDFQRQKHAMEAIQENSFSQCSQLSQMYKIQPKRRLFLCDTCLFYLPFIEIKSHHMQCIPPKANQDYRIRWQRLTQLLQQINRMHSSNELFRLVELMKAYISGRKNRQHSGGLYSQELERIMKYRLVVNLEELIIDDLFETIQKIGDKLQTLHKKQWGVWLLCS